jgi:Glycosyl transferase family 2
MSGAQERPDLWSRVHGKGSRLLHRARLMRSIRHVHGPSRFETTPEDVIVMALVRDGQYYLDGFFDHYRSIGARHFVFFDNGSDDGTISRIAREPGTIIVQSRLPWGRFENDFRRYAAETYCAGRWCLFADMDEQFDFEGSRSFGLAGLVRYLNAGGFTALVAQMLEMFPNTALHETAPVPFDAALRRYTYFDTTHVKAFEYHDPAIPFADLLQSNTLANDRIRFLFGGVRRKVFGEDCALTKHPLVFVGRDVQPGVHPHCSAPVACADFTALIRHYKFTNHPFERDRLSVQNAAATHGEDRLRQDFARDNPDLTLYSDSSVAFTTMADLQASGFLVHSPLYADFIAAQSDK